MGPRASLGGCGKSRPPQGFDPLTVQPVAGRYTDYAIPAQRSSSKVAVIFDRFSQNLNLIYRL